MVRIPRPAPAPAPALATGLLLALLLVACLSIAVPAARGAVAEAGLPGHSRAGPAPANPAAGPASEAFWPLAGMARASPPSLPAGLSLPFSQTGDLWFRPEPARTRLAIGLATEGRHLVLATDWRHSLSGSLDRAGWFLATVSQMRPGGSASAGQPRFLQQRLAIGRTWRQAGHQLTLQAGFSRVGLDETTMALTGRASRLGMMAGAQIWLDWPERGPAGLRFAQLALEADRARDGIGATARIGFGLGASGLALGPELLASAGARWRLGPLTYRHPYRHLRIGAHASGLRLGQASLTLSGGAILGSRERPRPYAALGLSLAY